MITTTFTFIATAEVIALLGLTPVLVDIQPDTFNIDPEAIARPYPQNKGHRSVHLFGQCADMDEILQMPVNMISILSKMWHRPSAQNTITWMAQGRAWEVPWGISAVPLFPFKNLGCYGDGGATLRR